MYFATVDTAKGIGGDYSALTIVDITAPPYKVVAKYRSNEISPLLYPSIVYKIATEYNNAYVLIEVNSSEQVAHILYHEYEYENVLFVTKDSATNQIISSGFGGSSSKMGVTTDKKVKRVGCNNLKTLVEENKLIIRDADIINELSTFIQKRDSYSADDGYHDDLVMTLVLFAWATANKYFSELTDVNLRQSIFKRQMEMIENELTPFGFYNDGSTTDLGSDFLQANF